MSDPAPQPAAPAPPPRRCRSLTVRGRQCIAHARHRFPVCPQGPKVAIPLLEDLDTIQVVATQVAHGLFTEILDPWRAGKILYALQVAALTIPRPAPLRPSEEKPLINEPVSQPESDLDGHFLGPDLPWKGNDAAFNPVWNYDKRLYIEECERLGKPIPTTPEEFPASGWLTKEEAREFDPKRPGPTPHDFLDQILQMRLQEDREGKLPPLYKRKCSYGDDRCKGPWDKGRYHNPCKWCIRERKERILLHPEEDLETVRYASELEPPDPWALNGWKATDQAKPAPSPDLKAAADPTPSRAGNRRFLASNSTIPPNPLIPELRPRSHHPGGWGVRHQSTPAHGNRFAS